MNKLEIDSEPLTEIMAVINEMKDPPANIIVKFHYMKEHLIRLLLAYPEIGMDNACVIDLINHFEPENNPVSY